MSKSLPIAPLLQTPCAHPFKRFYPHLRTRLLILERGEGREREKERNIDGLPLVHALTWDQARNLGLCPDPLVYGMAL